MRGKQILLIAVVAAGVCVGYDFLKRRAGGGA